MAARDLRARLLRSPSRASRPKRRANQWPRSHPLAAKNSTTKPPSALPTRLLDAVLRSEEDRRPLRSRRQTPEDLRKLRTLPSSLRQGGYRPLLAVHGLAGGHRLRESGRRHNPSGKMRHSEVGPNAAPQTVMSFILLASGPCSGYPSGLRFQGTLLHVFIFARKSAAAASAETLVSSM